MVYILALLLEIVIRLLTLLVLHIIVLAFFRVETSKSHLTFFIVRIFIVAAIYGFLPI
jgi:hypothetical protein